MSTSGCCCFRRGNRASAEPGTARAQLLGGGERCRHHSASPAQIPELTLLCKDLFAWGVQQVQLPEVQARVFRRSGSRREVGRVVLSHCRRCHALRHIRFGIHYLDGSPRLRACR